MAQFKVKPVAVKEYVPLKGVLCFSRKRVCPDPGYRPFWA